MLFIEKIYNYCIINLKNLYSFSFENKTTIYYVMLGAEFNSFFNSLTRRSFVVRERDERRRSTSSRFRI